MRAVLCPPTVYVSALDGDTHGTAGAANHAACSFQRSSVQVGHLGLGDLFHLSGGQRSDLFLVGLAGSGVDASGLLDQNSCRRSLAITSANCPKLSSKYWAYSSKHKRLILKNTEEISLMGRRGVAYQLWM